MEKKKYCANIFGYIAQPFAMPTSKEKMKTGKTDICFQSMVILRVRMKSPKMSKYIKSPKMR